MNQSKSQMQGSALFTLVGGIIITAATLALLVKLAGSGYYSDVAATTESATETRIMPSGRINMGDGTEPGQRTGQQVFDKICVQCHAADSTVAFAPKVTHNDQWAARIAQGYDTLIQHAISGFKGADGGVMPPKGGAADMTDDEIARAVAYMANKSGANFTEKAAGAAASGAASAATAPASASVAGTPAADAGGDAALAHGKELFEKTCVACHGADSKVAFAPKITKNDEWAPRIKQGEATLFKHAIGGFNGPDGGVMPPKGGNTTLSDDDVKAIVRYMVKQSGG